MAMLPPEMPISALEIFLAEFLARYLYQARNIVGQALVYLFAEEIGTSSLVRWIAGMTIWDGFCPAS